MPRSFKRKSGLRDARLIVIATEGEITEKQYFDGIIRSNKYKNPRVHVEVLSRGSSNSDPKACLNVLNKFKQEYHLFRDDELWLVCDVDRWGQKKLAEVSRLCRQKGYKVVVSNPCFESWLLLHHIQFDKYSEGDKRSFNEGCSNVEVELRRILGSYNKTNLKIEDFIGSIENAIAESRKLDIGNQDWPQTFGSRVFQLVESILR